MILYISKAATLELAAVSKYGAAIPNWLTPIKMRKKTSKIFPMLYTETPVTGSIKVVRVQPYQNPRAS